MARPSVTARLHDLERQRAQVLSHPLARGIAPGPMATYAAWQTPDIRSAVKSGASTVAELRAEGLYRFVTPDECVAMAATHGPMDSVLLHPLCGGMPIDEGWRCLELVAEKVIGASPTT